MTATRIRQNAQQKAEVILSRGGLPFPVTIPSSVPARDAMTEEEFHAMMAIGYAQAKSDDSFDIDDVFDGLEQSS